MQITRQQRINNIPLEMINGLRNLALQYRGMLAEGIDAPAQQGLAAIKVSAAEIRTSWGDNIAEMETVLGHILDGPHATPSSAIVAELVPC